VVTIAQKMKYKAANVFGLASSSLTMALLLFRN